MKESIAVFVLSLVMWVLSGIAHERDIYHACEDKGNSGKAMWTKSITCSPKQDRPVNTAKDKKK